MALLPLLWLALRRERRPDWWWLAGALAISWVADSMAHVVPASWVSSAYPVSQSGLLGAILLPKRSAGYFVSVLVAVGIVALWLGERPDVLLHTVAWLGLTALVWPLRLGRLKESLVLLFGLGWVAWLAYALDPGWASWLAFQGIRALGLGWFCLAQAERQLA
jgi:hypothetical protein